MVAKDPLRRYVEVVNTSSKFYVAYSGNIGFIIVGEGACCGHVEERIQSEELKNVALLPFQLYEKMSKIFSSGDAGLPIFIKKYQQLFRCLLRPGAICPRGVWC